MSQCANVGMCKCIKDISTLFILTLAHWFIGTLAHCAYSHIVYGCFIKNEL